MKGSAFVNLLVELSGKASDASLGRGPGFRGNVPTVLELGVPPAARRRLADLLDHAAAGGDDDVVEPSLWSRDMIYACSLGQQAAGRGMPRQELPECRE